MMIYWVVYYLSVFSPLPPVIIGVRQRNNLLWWYAIIGLLFDIAVTLVIRFGHFPHKDTSIAVAQNTFLVTEFLLISLYYRKRILKKKYFDNCIIPAAIALFIGSVLYTKNAALNFVGGAGFDFICIFYAVAGFYSLLKKSGLVFPARSAFFWVNVAFLIYCSGNFFIFLFTEYLMQSSAELSRQFWVLHNILNIVFSIFITIAFTKKIHEE